MTNRPRANSLHTRESLRRRTSWCCNCSQPVSRMLATVLEWLTDFLTGAIMESRKAARSKAVASPPWFTVLSLEPLNNSFSKPVNVKIDTVWAEYHLKSFISGFFGGKYQKSWLMCPFRQPNVFVYDTHLHSLPDILKKEKPANQLPNGIWWHTSTTAMILINFFSSRNSAEYVKLLRNQKMLPWQIR